MKGHCETCAHFHAFMDPDLKTYDGQCRIRSVQGTVWPPRYDYHWCSEHKPEPAEKPSSEEMD